jgi:hypothetical protein
MTPKTGNETRFPRRFDFPRVEHHPGADAPFLSDYAAIETPRNIVLV